MVAIVCSGLQLRQRDFYRDTRWFTLFALDLLSGCYQKTPSGIVKWDLTFWLGAKRSGKLPAIGLTNPMQITTYEELCHAFVVGIFHRNFPYLKSVFFR